MGIKGSPGHKSNHSVSKQSSMNISSCTVLNQLLTNAYGSSANIKDLNQLVIGGIFGVLIVLRDKTLLIINNYLFNCLSVDFFFKNYSRINIYGS